MIAFAFIRFLVSLLYPADREDFDRKEKLSEYHFFTGPLQELDPAPGVYPYAVSTPLFSNYSEKLRFLKLPEGTRMTYQDSAAFAFPTGTVLIKNFYYPRDFRRPEKGRFILETRLLVHEADGWQAYPYIWNEDQTEAFYDPAGDIRQVRYVNASGKKINTPYLVPNKNQCKGCHLKGNQMVPLGLSARQLNLEVTIGGARHNQLQHWRDAGIIDRMPSLSLIPPAIVWDEPSSGSLNDRARAYLDANCAHCHSRQGPANTSGLFLDVYETNPAHLGVYKSPVAAGRGAGNLKFDIVPGAPEKSILVFRMETNDPAVAMPEIGREQVHEEGVALIAAWIRENTFTKQ